MFLWLKLLAFGVAFLGQDAFLKGQETTTITPETTTVIPEASCDIISNIEDSENDPKMASVLLNIPTEDKEYIILGDGIDITVSSSNKSVELPKCQKYTVKVKNGKCSDSTSSSFLVPKVANEPLQVNNQGNTSARLCWSISLACANVTVTCNGTLSMYSENNGICGVLDDLSPNRRYDCTGSIHFHEINVGSQNLIIHTDYGVPGEPENLQIINKTTTGVTVSWTEPRDTSNGPIHGYFVKFFVGGIWFNETKINTTHYTFDGFETYTNASVSVIPYTINKENHILEGRNKSCAFVTNAGVPEKVNHVKTILTADNAVQITCKKQREFGPRAEFKFIWENDEKIENKSKCEFKRENLFYLTNYTFKIFVFNGEYNGPVVVGSIKTRYNSRALIIFLAFMIIVTVIALLLVLYKIYDLHKKKLSNSSEGVNLVAVKDDDKQLLNIEPIPSELLLDTYKRKIADEGRLFLEEFQSIPRVFSKFSIKEAKKSHNQNKNRYIDILPYDHNRVELSEMPGDPGSDYINASYIDGFKEPRKYIAAQGPKDETTDDFWRMIWEQKATIIVMVTRCEEGKKQEEEELLF